MAVGTRITVNGEVVCRGGKGWNRGWIGVGLGLGSGSGLDGVRVGVDAQVEVVGLGVRVGEGNHANCSKVVC